MIGILGGLGPLAGVGLAARLTQNTMADSDQEHLSFILLSHPGDIPDRTQYLLGNEKVNPAVAIAEKLLQLEQMGARVGVIACNTAHAPLIFDEVIVRLTAADSQLRLVHVIRETVAYIREYHRYDRVGVLSTAGTWRFGLYRHALEGVGIHQVAFSAPWVQRLQNAVYHPGYGIKLQKPALSEKAIQELHCALDELIRSGDTCAVLGCSEIPLAITGTRYRSITLLDPMDIVARALIKGSVASSR